MGIKRWLWKKTVIGSTVETVKNIYNEGSVIKGYKKTIKDEFCEDNPFTAPIYKEGKLEGKKEGYAEASDVYNKKLLELADEFLKQEKIFSNKVKEYETLMDGYEAEIEKLEKKADRTEEENAYLRELLSRERKLKNMSR